MLRHKIYWFSERVKFKFFLLRRSLKFYTKIDESIINNPSWISLLDVVSLIGPFNVEDLIKNFSLDVRFASKRCVDPDAFFRLDQILAIQMINH